MIVFEGTSLPVPRPRDQLQSIPRPSHGQQTRILSPTELSLRRPKRMRPSSQKRQHDSIAPRSTPSSTMTPSLLVKPSRLLLRCSRLLRRHSMLRLRYLIDSRSRPCHPCPKWPQSLLYHSTFTQPTILRSYRTCNRLQVTVYLPSFSRMAFLLNSLDPIVKQALVTAPLQPRLVQCCPCPRV
jgi:hypothetical protein